MSHFGASESLFLTPTDNPSEVSTACHWGGGWQSIWTHRGRWVFIKSLVQSWLDLLALIFTLFCVITMIYRGGWGGRNSPLPNTPKILASRPGDITALPFQKHSSLRVWVTQCNWQKVSNLERRAISKRFLIYWSMPACTIYLSKGHKTGASFHFLGDPFTFKILRRFCIHFRFVLWDILLCQDKHFLIKSYP